MRRFTLLITTACLAMAVLVATPADAQSARGSNTRSYGSSSVQQSRRQGQSSSGRSSARPSSGRSYAQPNQQRSQPSSGRSSAQPNQQRSQPLSGSTSGQAQRRPSTQARSARPQAGSTYNYNSRTEPPQARIYPDGRISPRQVHPAMRTPLSYDRPVCFWERGYHCFGYRVTYIPVGYTVVTCWGRPYYCYNGIYYRHYGQTYYVCRPPYGVFFDVVVDLAAAACRISYYNDVYRTSRIIDENAETIALQNRTIAENNATIASQNSTIAMNAGRASASSQLSEELSLVQSYADASVEYFYEDGVFFVKGDDGKYVTIVPPAGALVQALPEDYEVITLNGKEYYRIDDTVLRTTVVDGTAYFEVLGQLTGDQAKKFNPYNY